MANWKKEKRRKYRTRVTKKKVIILCEGMKTEKNYFKHFKKRGSLVEIIIVPSRGNTASKKLMEYSQKLTNWTKWNFNPDDGDLLWCVYDKDKNSMSEMKNAFKISQGKIYLCVFPSNPCFEVWYLLHYLDFANIPSSSTPQEIKRLLKRHLPGYTENLDVFRQLEPVRIRAIARVKKIFDQLSDDDKMKYKMGLIDPSSNIGFLLDKLDSFN